MTCACGRNLTALLAAVLLIFVARAGAQSPAESHARVELIADQAAATPGKPLWIGLLFHLDPGWHIYWQNPGDSGEPPRVAWQLPPGFSAGAIRWPQPVRLVDGTVVDYGYEKQVLLMAPIEAGQTHAPTMPNISADVKYIVCREICIPGKAHLTLAVPSAGDAARWRALFEETRQQLPKPAPAAWKVSAESKGAQFVLSVRGAGQVRGASFFPLDAAQIDNSSRQDFAPMAGGFRLTMKKSDLLVKPVATLRGLIVLAPGRAYEVSAPVVAR